MWGKFGRFWAFPTKNIVFMCFALTELVETIFHAHVSISLMMKTNKTVMFVYGVGWMAMVIWRVLWVRVEIGCICDREVYPIFFKIQYLGLGWDILLYYWNVLIFLTKLTVSLFGCTDAMVGIICRNLSSNYHELNHYDRFAQRHTLSAGKLLRSAESIWSLCPHFWHHYTKVVFFLAKT